ncbi:cation diffusion facilitator family transporter [Hydrogenivirga caldilitoris]|uniref:Cation diffusion facilitator family transporter n=1 Tax=Hydrogenivirga caldilitoris TaxID=246264 RepID=A0A497XPN1_9AQUI|nr:cation diffusion facilitator family transporter [Hydrogenivirga caldilitoris]RLJ70204.1 cation diffusion facilitator family transporter [Hydrogenivirga caldilitoris]
MKKEHWALVSLLLNLFQSALKFFAGFLTGSLSLLGEALHSLSDATASVIAYVSIKFSEKKHRRFPYGLYKLENIGAIVIAFFLIVAAYEIGQRAVSGRVEIDRSFLPVGIGVVVFSLLSSLTLSFLERRAGKNLNSPTLIADSYHTLTDAFGSALVLLSLSAAYLGYNYDRYFALAVVALILYTAFGLLREQVGAILDISADEETVEKIRDIILDFPEVESIKRLLVRSAGGRLFVDAEILLRPGSFMRSHAVADEIERKIAKEIDNVEMVFIHYEPAREERLRIAVFSRDGEALCRDFSNVSKMYIFEEKRGKPEVREVRVHSEEDVAKLLVREGVDIVICGHHPESSRAKWILHKNGIFVWETDRENIYEALSEVSKLRLDSLNKE